MSQTSAPAAYAWRKMLFPNRISALLCATGIVIDVGLAFQVPTHALWSGGPATFMSAAFLLWFWISMAWLAASLSGPKRMSSDRFGQGGPIGLRRSPSFAVARWLYGISLFLVVMWYYISWGICLQTGRFANWDTIWFAIVNARMLWDYLLAADTMQFAVAGITAIVVAVAIPWTAGRLRVTDRTADEDRAYRLRPLMVWLILGSVTLLARGKICDDLSVPRQVDRMHRVATALNPLVTLGTSLWMHITAEPIWPCLDERDLIPRTHERRRAAQPEIVPVTPSPSIIIIAVESLRHDMIGFVHQGQAVLPYTNQLAAQGLHLTRAYAQSTHSDYADLCLVSSLYPLRSRSHHFYRNDDPWPKLLLHDVLKRHGYGTAIISSQNEAWGGMDKFLETSQLDLFYHPERSDVPTVVAERDPGFWREHLAGTLVAGKFPDGHTTDVALQWIRDQVAAKKPYCLSMNYQSSHFPYLIPDDVPRPFQPSDLADEIKFSSYPIERTANVRNAYYNGIHECDRQIGRVIAELKRLGQLENTIVVVTGENGEAFHEAGCVGHAGLPVEPVVRVAAVMYGPGTIKPSREDYPFEHVDLAPTLLGILGLPSHPNFQGRNILATDRPPSSERLIFFHVISPMARADAVLLAGRWKWVVSHQHPSGVLYDLDQDSDECRDVTSENRQLAQQLAERLTAWRRNQLAYYHYPAYFLRYYPPAPPSWMPKE